MTGEDHQLHQVLISYIHKPTLFFSYSNLFYLGNSHLTLAISLNFPHFSFCSPFFVYPLFLTVSFFRWFLGQLHIFRSISSLILQFPCFPLRNRNEPREERSGTSGTMSSGKQSVGEVVKAEVKVNAVKYPFWFGGSASCFAACVTHPLDLGM